MIQAERAMLQAMRVMSRPGEEALEAEKVLKDFKNEMKKKGLLPEESNK